MSLSAWMVVPILAIATTNARAAGTLPRTRPAPGWSVTHADASNSDDRPLPWGSRVTHALSRSFDGMINLGPTQKVGVVDRLNISYILEI